MQLVLMRHGIAMNNTDPDCPVDDLRPLTPKGIKRTRESAEGLKALGVAPDYVYTSPLVRARETAEITAEVLGYAAKKIRVTENLRWEASPSKLLSELSKLGDKEILCVGHAPNLDGVLATSVSPKGYAFTSLGKAGAACVTVDPDLGDAVLHWLLAPRALRQLGA